jgi:hypothetical protein
MRSIWTIVATLAIANLLAIAGVLAWLGTSDRLSGARIQQIRDVLRVPLAEERARAAAEQAAAEQRDREAAEAQRLAQPPESAATRIARQEEAEQVHLQRVLRREQEQKALRDSLDRDRALLEEQRRAFAAEKKAFEDYRRRLADTEGQEQFRRALVTLEGQKPRDAKEVLHALIRESRTEQAVSYLSAMDDRVRSKVIAEFVKDDGALAADLLERLRTRGVALPSGPEAQPR